MSSTPMSHNKLMLLVVGIIGFVIIIGILYMLYQPTSIDTSNPQAQNHFTDNYQSISGFSNSVEDAIETFAIPDADFQKFMTSALAPNGLTLDQRKTVLSKLGCQTAIDQNMEGYRSLESGATFKVEKVSKIGEPDKYIVHAADNLVLSVDPATGRLSRSIKNTNDPKQLFTKETVKDAAGADTNTVIFTKELASGSKLALQYEHESLSLRPLDSAGKPWRGQQFTFDANLKGDLLDNAAMVLGYRLAPSVGGSELQNAGVAAMCGAGSGAATPLPSTSGSISNSSATLGSITQQQLNEAVAAALANINAFNQASGGAQPGTANNAFANRPIRVNLNLGSRNPSPTPTTRGVVRFADIPRNHSQVEGFAALAGNPGQVEGFAALAGNPGQVEGFAALAGNPGQVEGFAALAGNQYQTGQVRDLILAWDSAQPGADDSNNSLGGLPSSAAKTLWNTLRGKMVSCPKIDRSQYYTERQLSQCAGCTPDAYLRGQLGGQ